MSSVALLDDPDRIAAACHPLRRRLLDALDEPRSASGLSRLLDVSRQTANYHLRTLEELGLVALVSEEPVRGVTERFYARTSSLVLVDPAALEVRGLDARSARGVLASVAAGVQVIRRAVAVARAAAAADERVAAATLDATVHLPDPSAARAFTDDLADLVARHDRPGRGSMPFHVTTVLLPATEDS